MKSYAWIFFDADETLFQFDAFKGLQKVFAHYGILFSQLDYHNYQAINKPLWIAYQNGSITSQELRHHRFAAWASKLQTTSQELNNQFISAMAEISIPLQGAISLLDTLKGKTKLGIITNGFTELQYTRLERTGLSNHFDALITSEEVGIAKPHPAIFEHALSIVGNPPREQVLMVGDTPETDILGGINAGLDTCWFNANKNSSPSDITPHYQVSSLAELETLLSINKR